MFCFFLQRKNKVANAEEEGKKRKKMKKKKFSPSFGISGLFFLMNTLTASFIFKNFVGRRRVGSENNGKNPSIIQKEGGVVSDSSNSGDAGTKMIGKEERKALG